MFSDPSLCAEINGLAGVVVVDVVEGTALASLPFMDSVLRGRPAQFDSLAQAVEWALSTGALLGVGVSGERLSRLEHLERGGEGLVARGRSLVA